MLHSRPISSSRWLILLGSGLLILLSWACAPSPPPGPDRTGSVLDDQVQDRTRADLVYLDGLDSEGRRTATVGFNRAATYLSGQMRAVGLQPVLTDEYRLQYAALLRRALFSRVRFLGADTTEIRQGEGYLIVGTPSDTLASGSIPALAEPAWIRWAEGIASEAGDAGRWDLEVATERQASTAPMHVIGLLPGAHPVLKDSLVLVLAPFDGSGLQGAASWTDGTDLAIPAGAVLSSMRQVAAYQQRWALYPQTTMFALLSGTRDACQGPEQFVKHLPWDRSLVSTVIVVAMQADHSCDWGAVLASEGMSPRISMLPAYVPFEASAEAGFGPWRPRSTTQRPDVLDVATDEALRLAQEIVKRMP